MHEFDPRSAQRPEPDHVLVEIADYVLSEPAFSPLAYETARYCLMDSLACAMQALDFPACMKLLGPIVPGATLTGGARVPGTAWELDPVTAAFNIGAMIRWLDFNDTWLAAEWGHPSDNLGAILAVADYLDREGDRRLHMRDVLSAMIKAYEIQGVLALENSFNRVGLDHVLLVRIASTALATQLLGGDRVQVVDALSNAWIDGGALRTYRHAPNTGSRKSWAAGDACARAVRLALLALRGEMGYPSALTAPKWGFYDVLFDGRPILIPQRFGSYVMENILLKISYPAEFHAQTAVEAAITLHPQVCDRLDQIERVVIETQEPGVRIIDKTGPLSNPADRDHCIQYMVAVPLLFGRLTAADYEDAVAADPRIDALRARTEVVENISFTQDYYDSEKRYIANAVQVFFRDGSSTQRVQIDAPIGHRLRRAEAIPLLWDKFNRSLESKVPGKPFQELRRCFEDRERLSTMRVSEFMTLLAKKP